MNDNDLDNRTVQQLKDYVDDRISQLHDEQIEETLSLLRSLGVSRDRADQAADRIMAVSNVDRRTAVQIVAAAAVGSSIGAGGMFAMTDPAQAAASTSDSNGDVGTPSDRIDVFADGIDLADVIEDDSGNNLLGQSVASGSVTLSSGAATVDTGISESTTATFFVALGPDTDDAEVAASIDANSGGNYVVHIDEVNTSVGNPTIRYDIVRVR